MARNRKSGDDGDVSDTRGKLSRLLETESELDELLEQAKRQAAAQVKGAKADAEARINALDAELDAENDAVRAQVELERDRAIASIQEAATRETAGFDDLDDARIEDVAAEVIRLLVGRQGSGGQS